MFTGIILKMGKLISLEKKSQITLTVETGLLENVKIGDSVAVNGACLTVIAFDAQHTRCKFNLSKETLKLSNIGDLPKGSYVNLELPLTLNDFLGGHMVSGHLGRSRPGQGDSAERRQYQNFICLSKPRMAEVPRLQRFRHHKRHKPDHQRSQTELFFRRSHPHSLDSTNLKYLKIGERVNLELDLMGKYLYNLRWADSPGYR